MGESDAQQQAARDAELVSRTLAGDRSAFEALVGAYQARACAIAGSVLAGDQAAIDDAVQEAFVLAYRRLGDLGNPERFAAWLRRIVHNQAVTWLRRHRRGKTMALADDGLVADADADDPADEAAAERLAQLQAVLPKLRAPYREILALKYEAGLSYDEIAATLGTSVANVEKRLYRARKRLLDLMGG